MKKFLLFFVFLGIFLFISDFSYAGEMVLKYNDAITWNFEGRPVSETYWTPYLPPVQALVRFKIGVRLSGGDVGIKDSVEVVFNWDDNQAKAGKVLKLKIKPKFSKQNKTFESAFGLHLPNVLEAGIVGVWGLGEILPWITIPYDLKGLLSLIPEVKGFDIGEIVSTLVTVIGVNMTSNEPLPIGGTAEYHDKRTLLDINFVKNLKISDGTADTIWNNIFSKGTRDKIISAIKLFKNVDDAGAAKLVKGLIKSGVEKFLDDASFKINGDPAYKLTGEKLTINVSYWVPGKLSGNYPITFDANQKEFELPIPLPIFINPGDHLNIKINGMSYTFKLEQILKFSLKLVQLEQDIVDHQRVIAYPTVYAQNQLLEGQIFQIPIAKSDEAILNYKINTGSDSATAWWASPNVMLKGTVKVYKENQLIAEKTEPNFTNSHQVSFTGLTPDTEYTFKMTCVDTQGNTYPEMVLNATTKPPTTLSSSSLETKTFYSASQHLGEYPQGTRTDLSMTNYQATSTHDSITFTWKTNVPASTEILMGVSQDFYQNYIGFFKKTDGTEAWVERGYFGSRPDKTGEREMVTDHRITITGLEPDTTYYYRISSWTFTTPYAENKLLITNDPRGNCHLLLSYVGSIKTKPAPPQPYLKVEVKNGSCPGKPPLANASVFIEKVQPQGQAGLVPISSYLVTTNANGVTPDVILERPTTGTNFYRIKIEYPNFSKYESSSIQVGQTTQGFLGNFQAELTMLPPSSSVGGYVYDENGQPIANASISISKGGASYNPPLPIKSDNNGWYANDLNYHCGLFSQFGPGDVDVTISKSGYATTTIKGTISQMGIFSAPLCILPSTSYKCNVFVKTVGDMPVANTTVVVKKGNTNYITATTNSNGMAYISFPGENLPQEDNFTLEVPAIPGQGILSATKQVTLKKGEEIYTEITCPKELPPITDLSARQLPGQGIEVSFSVLGRDVKSAISYYKPDGTYIESPWSDSYNQGILTHLIGNDNPAGLYRIKAKVKDMLETMRESDFIEFFFFKGESLQPKVTEITSNGAKISWNAFPRDTEFGKYDIACSVTDPWTKVTYKQIKFSINNRSTNSYVIENLEARKDYTCSLWVYDKNGGELGHSPDFNFSTLPGAPSIAQFVIYSPVVAPRGKVKYAFSLGSELGLTVDWKLCLNKCITRDNLILSGTSTGPDARIGEFQAPEEEGTYDLTLVAEYPDYPKTTTQEERRFTVSSNYQRPIINVESFPKNIPLYQEAEFVFSILNFDENKKYYYEINWGDGNEERDVVLSSKSVSEKVKKELFEREDEEKGRKVTFKLSHTYTYETGSEAVTTITLKVKYSVVGPNKEESYVESDPLHVHISTIWMPVIEFSRVPSEGRLQTFNIKAKAPHPSSLRKIKSWHLDFGNGRSESGEGEVERVLTSEYLPKEKETYKAVFTVTTDDNKTYTKELSFGVTQASSLTSVPKTGPAGLLRQEEASPQKTATIDLVLERIDLASELFLGEKTIVAIVVKNDYSEGVENVPVKLETEDGFNETKEITLKPQSTETLEFLWTPQRLGRQKITVLLDYQDSNLRNNRLIKNVEVKQKEAKPIEEKKEEKEPIDLSLERIDIKPEIFVNEKTEIVVNLRNNSKETIENCLVILETEDGFKDKKLILLGPNKLEKVIFTWTPKQVGKQKITASLEYKDDSNPKNNQLTQRLEVKSKEEEKKEEEKKEEVSINIIRITLEGEKQETLPIDSPLTLILELDSSVDIDFKEPIEVNISLKGKEFQEDFREKITQLQKGRNKIRFELLDELKPDKYNLRLELFNPEYKIRLKQEKNFVVEEER